MPAIELDVTRNANIPSSGGRALVHHCMHLVRENRMVRDRLYKRQWDQFERTFRGLYSGSDQIRQGERSRLVAPALASAIESVAATLEDAVFSRERWFEIDDDRVDQQPEDINEVHRRLEEDFDIAGVPDAIAKTILSGCLYGTGIASAKLASALLEEAGVALLNGRDFGDAGEGFLRISYASSRENLIEGCRRIRDYLSSV